MAIQVRSLSPCVTEWSINICSRCIVSSSSSDALILHFKIPKSYYHWTFNSHSDHQSIYQGYKSKRKQQTNKFEYSDEQLTHKHDFIVVRIVILKISVCEYISIYSPKPCFFGICLNRTYLLSVECKHNLIHHNNWRVIVIIEKYT